MKLITAPQSSRKAGECLSRGIRLVAGGNKVVAIEFDKDFHYDKPVSAFFPCFLGGNSVPYPFVAGKRRSR